MTTTDPDRDRDLRRDGGHGDRDRDLRAPLVTLLLVRHGETDWNVEGRWQGQGGPELNATGLRQAEAVAARLRPLAGRVVRVITSDLPRADQTARAIGRAVGRTPEHDRRLREIDVGAWQGLTHEEAARDPEGREPWGRGVDARFGGGESIHELRERMLDFLDDIRAHHVLADGEADNPPSYDDDAVPVVIAVSHGGTLRAGVSGVLGMPHPRPLRGCANTGVTTLECSAVRGWRLHAYNSDDHVRDGAGHATTPARSAPPARDPNERDGDRLEGDAA